MTVNIDFMYYLILLLFYGFARSKLDFFILFYGLLAVSGDTKFKQRRIPKTPVIGKPKRVASRRPRRSSINNSSAFNSQARAIASASPRSKL